jgi:DNA-binding response OmpR family regulator
VIDDDAQFLRLMERTLRNEYEVLTALDALDGYTLLCRDKPDLVLLDVMMPMVDGWTLLRKIRSNATTSRLRVIVVTGLDPEAAAHEAGRHGVTTILHKPVLPDQLVKAVRETLAESPSPITNGRLVGSQV